MITNSTSNKRIQQQRKKKKPKYQPLVSIKNGKSKASKQHPLWKTQTTEDCEHHGLSLMEYNENIDFNTAERDV
jgi:hypothetical protein